MLRTTIVTFSLLFTLSAASAADPTEKLELCMSCHGETGVSEMPNVPPIGGKAKSYLADQLKAFRDQTRQNPQMLLAKRLADAEIDALSAYYAAQKSQTTGVSK